MVVDVLDMFMQADMDDEVHVRFSGEMVEKLLEIDYEMCSPFMVEENGAWVLFIELLETLYGTLKVA